MPNLKNKRPLDENGIAHGEWITYHRNGKLYYRCNYVHGVEHGLCENFNDDGTIMSRGYINMGRLVGFWYNHFKRNDYYLCLI